MPEKHLQIEKSEQPDNETENLVRDDDEDFAEWASEDKFKSDDFQLCDENMLSDKGWVVVKYEGSIFPGSVRKIESEGQTKMTEKDVKKVKCCHQNSNSIAT